MDGVWEAENLWSTASSNSSDGLGSTAVTIPVV